MKPDPVVEGTQTADPAAPVLERAQTLLEDLSLNAVRTHKENNPGALAVGIMPIYAPRPLFEAMNVLPVGVYGAGDGMDIIRGDSYYQSYICHIPRSTLEMGLNGSLDALDGMIFPSTCDVIRNLGGMWQMLFPDRYSSYLDLPQDFAPDRGGVFYRYELQRIARDLESRGARPLDPQRLAQAIADENVRRAALDRLDQMRASEPHRVRASEVYLIGRAGQQLTAAAHTALIEEYLAATQQRQVRAYDNVRVVVLGAFCEQPPLGLIRTLEHAGCDLVEDDFQMGLKMVEGNIALTAQELDAKISTKPLDVTNPLDALVLAYLMHGAAGATRYIGSNKKGEALASRVKALNADGVIFAAPSFCDPALLDQPMQEAALNEAGIPHTSFKYSENSGQFQAIREQAGAFSDSVKLWGHAA